MAFILYDSQSTHRRMITEEEEIRMEIEQSLTEHHNSNSLGDNVDDIKSYSHLSQFTTVHSLDVKAGLLIDSIVTWL